MAAESKTNDSLRYFKFNKMRAMTTVVLAVVAGIAIASNASVEAQEIFGREPQLVLETGGFPGGISDVAFSPDGKQLAVAGVKIVRVFSVDTGELITTIRGDRSRSAYGSTNTCCYTPDGKYLLVGVYDYHERGSIRMYRTDNLAQIDQLLPGHKAPCTGILFNSEGKTMVTCDSNGEIFVWDWASRRIVTRIPPTNPDKPVIKFMAVVESPTVVVAANSDSVHIYNATSGKDLSPQDNMPPMILGWWYDFFADGITWPEGAKPYRFNNLNDFNFPAGLWCASGRGGTETSPKFWCGVWKARPMMQGAPPVAPKTLYQGHKWEVRAIKLSRDGKLVASGDKFGEVHIWDAATGAVRHIIKSSSRPYYEAAFDESTDGIVLGNKVDRNNWAYNQYGIPERMLDLTRRSVRGVDAGVKFIPEKPSIGNVELGVLAPSGKGQSFYLSKKVGGKQQSAFRLPAGQRLSVYTLLEKPALGVEQPVLYADTNGTLEMWDPVGNKRHRFFQGHHSMVTSISVADNGKVFVTGSTDHTVRIWSLVNYKSNGFLDFEFQDSAVYKLKPGSSSQRAGVKVGDKIRTIDGKRLDEVFELMMLGNYNYRPGQVVPVKMLRGEKEYTYNMTMDEGFDYVEPLLNVYLPNDNEWIIWTPKGYYDCSPGADRYVGWHVNQGPDKAAKFYKAEQFKKELYRPDIINEIVRTGDVDQAIQIATNKHPQRGKPRDFTDPAVMKENAPPSVVFEELKPDPADPRVTVKGTVTVSNDQPIREVTLLQNGLPAKVFKPSGNEAKGPFSFEFRCKLVPGRNVFSAIASNSVTSSAAEEATLELKYAGAGEKAKVYALAIGISKYANSGKDFQDLKYADKDAREFIKALEKHRQGQIYHDVETKILVNEEASRRNILDGVQWLVDNVKSGDVVMIFAAGHGFMERDNFYLATHEVDKSSLRATGISWREIVGTLHEDLPACKRVIFLDACHSAGVADSDSRNPLHDLSSPELGTIFFASSTVQEESFEDADWSHGAFTKSLLDLMADKRADFSPQAGDGLLNARELESGVLDRVVTMTRDRQHPVVFVPIPLRSYNVLELLQ